MPFAPDGDGVRLLVRVTARAKKTDLAGIVETPDGRAALAVRLAAPPVDGAANKALLAFIASALGVPRSRIRITAGETSRLKTLRVAGLAAAQLAERLGPLP